MHRGIRKAILCLIYYLVMWLRPEGLSILFERAKELGFIKVLQFRTMAQPFTICNSLMIV